MRICVFGASGPVGRAVVDQALAAGHHVTAVTRRPNEFPGEAPQLRVTGGDVMQLSQVEAALHDADSVISTTGVNPSRKPITTYSVGTHNMLEAMRLLAIRRIVSVSSKNLAENGSRGEPLAYRIMLGPLLHTLNRTLYDDMRRMEGLLRSSDLDWTIVRPAGLFAGKQISAYRCTDEHEAGVFTSTLDLADLLIGEATGDQPRLHNVLEVMTDADTPSLPALIVGQAALHAR